MEPTIPCGKHLAEHADIAETRFHDVNLARALFDDVCLAGAAFENVNLSGVRMHDINLSDLDLSAAQIGGAHFKHIGCPPGHDGRQERQRPVLFEEAMLGGSTFRKVDLSGVKIVECNVEGMTIDGVLVTDLLAAYEEWGK